MSKELELWQFIASRLENSESVLLLVVVESSGSSPGRAGYKMAVAADGELIGSIGGGVMEVRLVEQAKAILSEPGAVATGFRNSTVEEQVHQKNKPNASGMVCSGKQTVIFRLLAVENAETIAAIIHSFKNRTGEFLTITPTRFSVETPTVGTQDDDFDFEVRSGDQFHYREKLGPKNSLYIIGGGHCALALSELMSKMDFHMRIFDDRPELNTLDKNRFADGIEIVESYENIADHISSAPNAYVVVMTLGYSFDKIVIQKLLDKEFKYFGVLGSRAKMATLMKELRANGFDKAKLKQIHTPVGLPINSRTPEEIAVSIAAEIISVKNS
ncbi:MAG: XdhC family protein [Pyrinomonadaceae bacterium]